MSDKIFFYRTQMIAVLAADECRLLAADMVPGLLKAYSHTDSRVRKSSVFALVALHLIMGENLRPLLGELNGSKVYNS